MYRTHAAFIVIAASLLTLSMLACGTAAEVKPKPSEPTAAITPITLVDDLTTIDLCQAIPREDMEAIMGRELVKDPERFNYYETGGSSGCQYDGGKSSDGEAFFSYVVLTPAVEYDNQPLYLNADVTGLGQSAYFNNGADARQLWVKINDTVAFVVAKGDVPNEAGLKAIAQLMLAAVQ